MVQTLVIYALNNLLHVFLQATYRVLAERLKFNCCYIYSSLIIICTDPFDVYSPHLLSFELGLVSYI